MVAGDEHELAPVQARARAPRRTGAPRPAPRAAVRDAARARRRAAPADRRRSAARSSGARSSGRRSRSAPRDGCRDAGRRRSACAWSASVGGGAGAVAPDVRSARAPERSRHAIRESDRIDRRRRESRTGLGSMKRTSSRITWNSEMSETPRCTEQLDELLHEVLGGARARGDADDPRARAATPRGPPRRCRSGAPRCRSRARPRRGAPSSRSCASRSRASDRSSSAICLTADWRLVVA